MKRIAHISDTHIRNLKYHDEYRHVFNQIYDSLKQEQPDYIVHTGDLAHTKTQLSPEYFEMASNFLKSLSDIAPTIMILGNHDGNLKNGDRQDAVTPIAEAMQHPNFTLLKNSGEYSPEPGITFNVLSVFDRDNWRPPSNLKSVNIALYHGAVRGSQVGSGFSLDHGEDDLSIFSDFDYAMLGDIHRTQSLDSEDKVWYCGSTVQQNFGESQLKGYLIWNIHSKEKHSIQKRLFRSPRPFITIELNQDGTLPKAQVPKNSRLRLVCNHNLPMAKLKRACDYAQVKWSTHSVSFVNNSSAAGSVSSAKNGKALNMRDPKNQEKFLREFMEDQEISNSIREKVVELSRDYLKKVDTSTGMSRNVVWGIKKMQWNYLFNYGKGNTLDFSKLNGLVGIFGKNYSGKSSIIDAALFGLFNTTSKGERKNVHIINQNQERALCKLEIAVGDDLYKVTRSLEKTTVRSKGKESHSAKTELDFTKYSFGTIAESKNGDTRNKTDENIRNTFGSLEDFMMTSLAAQNDSFGFINEGSTKRKEILAKFLDLQIFDQMHKLAKQDSAEMRGVIKHLQSLDWDKKLSRAEAELCEILEDIGTQRGLCVKHGARLETLKEEQQSIKNQVDAASQKEINIESVKNILLKARKSLSSNSKEMNRLSIEISSKRSSIEDLSLRLPSLLEESAQAKAELQTLEMLKDQISKTHKSVEKAKRERSRLQSKIDMLHDHEYDPDCSFCSDNEFVKKAEEAKITIVEVIRNIESLNAQMLDLKMKASTFAEITLKATVKDYEARKDMLTTNQSEVRNMSLQWENCEGKVSLMERKIKDCEGDITYYNDNIEAYENLTSLQGDFSAITKTVSIKAAEIQRCEEKVLGFMSEKGSSERMIQEASERIQQIKDAERDYIAYDIFVKATHPNGISYEVIKSMLPVINEEIQKVLSSIVDFQVFFAEDGDKLEIYLKHPKYDPRPLSMGSGAEKTIASMAVRLALISVSSLPKSNIFVLDEPATALDAEHMEGFARLLQMIKTQFKTVLLITHLESLKDVVDMSIDIDKTDGYAQVNL
jgi:DNA repair exonuclease SbcCD ATPase subunit/DNA repair exonuclease SbcCD nuclease subunit|tara:strand:- start:222 stop:3377 length:3156 start_codon:yes stop_codon:yes gene_type:complete